MIDDLTAWMSTARWFGGKGRGFTVAGLTRVGEVSEPGAVPRVSVELARIVYDDGTEDLYQVPLAAYPEAQDRLGHALVGVWPADPPLAGADSVHVYDAVHDREATASWLRRFDAASHQAGGAGEAGGTSSLTPAGLTFRRLPGHDLDLGVHSTLFSGEQSNSSVAFGEDAIMKVFRRLVPGPNPDVEIHEALTRAETPHVAALYGWLEAPSPDGGPLHLAMLQQFLRTATDGWDLALTSVRNLYAEGDLHADEVGGDFAAESHRLGIAVAEVHEVMRERFAVEGWAGEQVDELVTAMTARLDAATAIVPGLAQHADAVRETYAALRPLAEEHGSVLAQRVHGDLHLGQTLRTVASWKIVDFEGEPAKSLAERVRPDSPWRDVAGMLRSFDYAANVVARDLGRGDDPQTSYRGREWTQRNREAFLTGYRTASSAASSGAGGPGSTGSTGSTGDAQATLLRAYELEKAVYETVYEARNRPTWVDIPLSAIGRLVAG